MAREGVFPTSLCLFSHPISLSRTTHVCQACKGKPSQMNMFACWVCLEDAIKLTLNLAYYWNSICLQIQCLFTNIFTVFVYRYSQRPVRLEGVDRTFVPATQHTSGLTANHIANHTATHNHTATQHGTQADTANLTNWDILSLSAITIDKKSEWFRSVLKKSWIMKWHVLNVCFWDNLFFQIYFWSQLIYSAQISTLACLPV